MADYRTQCAWCHKELEGSYITFLPAFDYQFEDHRRISDDELAVRYCSSKCVTHRRSELFHRRKLYGEKWPRYCVEVPPELAAMLDAATKAQLGVNVRTFSRAGVVRWALRTLLDEIAPIPEVAVETSASDVIDLLELESGSDHG